MTGFRTLSQLIEAGEASRPALRATEGRAPLTYGALRDLAARTVAALNAKGIGRGDRVAIVLPNGPEMASVFLAVACGATTAPLNPAYRGEEFEFYIDDLKAKALVVAQGHRDAGARRRGEARRAGDRGGARRPAAGDFTLEGGASGSGARARPRAGGRRRAGAAHLRHHGAAEDRAADAWQRHAPRRGTSAQALALTPGDACLNVMPLFHIHGLIAAVLSSLGAGGSVVCTPGFDALRFFRWMDEETAELVHRGADHAPGDPVARRAQQRRSSRRVPLRFIRSSSASLPGPVMEQMEETFGAPLVESYGMTEASHQMASNPLAGPRKPGKVGLAGGAGGRDHGR